MLNQSSRVSPPGSWHGLSAGGYALYNVTLEAVFVSAFAMVAGVIFRVAVAGALVTIFTIGAAIYLPKEDVGPKMLSMLLMDAFTLFIPLSIGVLRVRLFDIVVIINRTLVDGSLTAILALVYLGGVTITQSVLQTLTGNEELPQLAIVASTLVIAAPFSP